LPAFERIQAGQLLDYAISDSDDPAADGFQAGNHAQQR
jgi:hypothetical protein